MHISFSKCIKKLITFFVSKFLLNCIEKLENSFRFIQCYLRAGMGGRAALAPGQAGGNARAGGAGGGSRRQNRRAGAQAGAHEHWRARVGWIWRERESEIEGGRRRHARESAFLSGAVSTAQAGRHVRAGGRHTSVNLADKIR